MTKAQPTALACRPCAACQDLEFLNSTFQIRVGGWLVPEAAAVCSEHAHSVEREPAPSLQHASRRKPDVRILNPQS